MLLPLDSLTRPRATAPRLLALALVLLAGWGRCAGGPGPSAKIVWRYELLEGSELVDDCPICGRPTIIAAIRGSFTLRLLAENPLTATYAVENVNFMAGSAPGFVYEVRGGGILRLGGEVAVIQEMILTNQINNGSSTTTNAILVNEVGIAERRQPMLQIQLHQTNGTFTQVYDIRIAAAPLRELWFSTVAGFHSAVLPASSNAFSGGDLLSRTRRAVRTNHELTRSLGVMPPTPDLGLDAVDILPGGEIAFSVEQTVFSETLGPLQQGDVLSERGRVLWRNQELLLAFGIQPPVPDAGLDALHILPPDGTGTNEIWFSVERDQFSENLNRTLHRGDVLSSRGRVVRSNQELLARFQPDKPAVDYGLDALYVWPSGEIWFSTETGFLGTSFQTFTAGDLLSDQGYVVFRNLELLGPFAPIEDLADFGLDALWIVTDAISAAAPPQFTGISRLTAAAGTSLRWRGEGQVFQVEAAREITGPFVPIGPIAPDLELLEPEPSAQGNRFYRLLEW